MGTAGGSCLEGLTPCQRCMSLSAPCQSRNNHVDKPYLYMTFSSRMWLVGNQCWKGESTERTAAFDSVEKHWRILKWETWACIPDHELKFLKIFAWINKLWHSAYSAVLQWMWLHEGCREQQMYEVAVIWIPTLGWMTFSEKWLFLSTESVLLRSDESHLLVEK